ERGRTIEYATAAMSRGFSELLARDFIRAEGLLREGWDELGRLGEGGYRSTIGSYLGEALVELGRPDEAIGIVDEAQAITSPDDWVTHTYCDYVRGLVTLSRGDHEEAAALVRAAIAVADEREYITTRSIYWLGLGRVLLSAGQLDQARP